MANMTSAVCSVGEQSFLVALHNAAPASDTEWDAYLDLARQLIDRAGQGQPKVLKGFTITSGGSPSAAQRKRMGVVVSGVVSEGVIITDNPLMRGVITAVSWVTGIKLRTCRQAEARPHLNAIGIADAGLERLVAELMEPGAAIDGTNPVAALQRALELPASAAVR